MECILKGYKMGKMSEISVVLQEYEQSLHSYGHMDPLVVALKRELLSYGIHDVNDLVRGIDMEFDTLVFNGQTEMF
jgi:hypothetical protein